MFNNFSCIFYHRKGETTLLDFPFVGYHVSIESTDFGISDKGLSSMRRIFRNLILDIRISRTSRVAWTSLLSEHPFENEFSI